MTLEQLRIFVAVADRQHVTRAADALNLAQSAVSAAIAALEANHQTKLFHRVGRGIELTETGRLFLPEAHAVLARSAAAELVLAELGGLERGTLSVQASQTIASYWLPRYLAAFRRNYSKIDIAFSVGNTAQVARSVRDGVAELGFVEGAVEDSTLSSAVVARDQMVLVVGNNHPWAARDHVGRDDLTETEWVLREPGSGTRSEFEAALRGLGILPTSIAVAMTLPSNESVRAVVEAGLGAAAMSATVAAPSLEAGLLHQVKFSLPERSFQLLRHRERSQSRAAEAVVSGKFCKTGLGPSGHGMRVMCEVTNPVAREHTMTKAQSRDGVIAIKALLESDPDFLRASVQAAIEAALEAEMTETLGAGKSERTEARLGYRAGYYQRSLITRVGTLELRVPQDRAGRFSTELFARYQRSEKALVSALAEMYVQGVSTRKVKAVTEALCGHEFSASSISAANKSLDAALTAFSRRKLSEPYPYLILDARYERVREGGVIASQAVLIAVAVDGEGRRQVLAVELANRESRSSWRDFLLELKQRGLCGVEFVVSDDHPGLKAAIREVLTEAAWQRCYVHFLRNALDYVPRRVDDDCLMELRWFYDRRDLAEVRRDLAAWLAKWQGKYPKLCGWVEDNIEETLTFYRLPLAHHKHMKSTNMLERLNQELKRRTHVVRIFPNAASCLRLVRALAVETHENWLEATRYLNMDHLKEHKKQMMRQAA